MYDYIGELSKEVTIERAAEYGIILEKSYTIEFVYELLQNMAHVDNLLRVLNPIWGEHILYFDYKGKAVVIVSAKGAPAAANAVERIRRTGARCIVSIGTCGSTNESITDGSFLLASGGIRDEGVSRGYLDLKVPAMSSRRLTDALFQNLVQKKKSVEIGLIYTTDNRYREEPDELMMLNKRANVLGVDMETSAILLVGTYHGMDVSTIKIVTDCAVKETEGELKGVFDRSKDFITFVHPRLEVAFTTVLEVFGEWDN